MTPKIIELKQAPAVLVEFPEGTNPYSELTRKEMHSIDIPTSRLIGVLSDLTEEQFAKIVRKVTLGYFLDYKHPFKRHDFMCSTPSESFRTLLESENVYTENLLGKAAESIGHGTLDNFDQDYAEAQSRTIDPTRTVVLIKSK